jgi:hypothetical protein
MTYREAIQKMIADVERIYDECEGLRDHATNEEKDAWNAMRKTLYDASRPLRRLDNSLSQSRANTKL